MYYKYSEIRLSGSSVVSSRRARTHGVILDVKGKYIFQGASLDGISAPKRLSISWAAQLFKNGTNLQGSALYKPRHGASISSGSLIICQW